MAHGCARVPSRREDLLQWREKCSQKASISSDFTRFRSISFDFTCSFLLLSLQLATSASCSNCCGKAFGAPRAVRRDASDSALKPL